MVILIMGASHTGKTLLSQKLLEKYGMPYFSIDHLKMGLIRSGNTDLTPEDDEELVPYLWGIVKEIVKTAVENKQNLILEGSYIPFDWKKDFEEKYLEEIRFFCLVMSEKYIKNNYDSIEKYASVIEARKDDPEFLNVHNMISENLKNFEACKKYGLDYILIDEEYCVDITL